LVRRKLDAAFSSNWMCSLKAPWRAKTPTVIPMTELAEGILGSVIRGSHWKMYCIFVLQKVVLYRESNYKTEGD